MMEIIPAIDIMDNKVVRLVQGDPLRSKTYMENPLEAALHWENQGAGRIHVIDLDAALEKSENKRSIITMANKLNIPVQTGGGIRTINSARYLLDQGVDRVILGSMPLKQPEDAIKLLSEYGAGRIVIALDHEHQEIKIGGWKDPGGETLNQALDLFGSLGFEWFLVTDIVRDGTLLGPDIKTIEEIANRGSIIASGGVSKLSDLTNLKKVGVKGAVIGKALYEERFTLQQALKEVGGC